MIKPNCYNDIFNKICNMSVIDTHEHLSWDEESRGDRDFDVLQEYLMHYLKCDLISAGLKKDVLDKAMDVNRSIVDRWSIVEPYWEASRFTGYGRALDIAVKGIYNIDGINRNTIEELNQSFKQNNASGHYKHVLKDLCNIHACLLDVWTFRLDGNNPLFKRVWQPQNFINPMPPEGHNILGYIEEHYSIQVKCLDDWLEALEKELDYMLTVYNMRVIKSSIAYFRTLKFEKVDYATAKRLFSHAIDKWNFTGSKQGLALEFPHELQDYLMHYILGLANKRNLTFQFHTGLLEGNGNVLTNSEPSLMINLFLEYPDVDFDIFHISYPYQNVACALSKTFPNVYLDMCWAHIISPFASVQALGDFLDAVPYNKISAFGGDYLFVDGVYGHLQLARESVSRVLAQKVEQNVFGVDRAIDIAKALFYDNPKRIFKI